MLFGPDDDLDTLDSTITEIEIDDRFGCAHLYAQRAPHLRKITVRGTSRVEVTGPVEVVLTEDSQGILCDCTAVVKDHAVATALRNVQMTVTDDAMGRAHKTSSVLARGRGTVWAQDQSSVTAYDEASFHLSDRSVGFARDRSTCHACNGSTVHVRDDASAFLSGYATGWFSGRAQGSLRDTSRGYANGDAKLLAADDATAGLFDRAAAAAYDRAYVVAHSESDVVVRGRNVIVRRDTEYMETEPETLPEGVPLGLAGFLVTAGYTVRDGKVIAYKAVRDDYRSSWGTLYDVGTDVTCYDWRPDGECGGGLHFSPRPDHALGHDRKATRMLECEVGLSVVCLIQDGTTLSKFKSPTCRVLREVSLHGFPVN